MARKVRNNELETRTGRLKLPIAKKPVFVRIGPGLALGYRRNKTAGAWVLKIADGRGGRSITNIGYADDFDDADGEDFVTFWQAQERAKQVARKGKDKAVPLTVKAAADTYLEWLAAKNPTTASDTRGRLEKHFLPKFGSKLVSSLTKTSLDSWLASIVRKDEDPERIRKSKDSANRVLSMVKALLNHAIKDPSNGLADDSAWRHVKPFHGVARPREIRFTDEELKRLIESAPDDSMRNLIKGGILTGARYGELINARVGDFDPKTLTLKINFSKTKNRNIILQSGAVKFFQELTNGSKKEDYLFTQENGEKWKRSDQTRRFKGAAKAAELTPDACFYALRHTYVSQSIEGEVPLNLIADNCGTSVRMIEKNYAKVLAERQRHFIEKGAPTL